MSYDTWDLITLREAAEYNRANPDPQFAEVQKWVEEQLSKAEHQRLHVTATPVADEEEATRRPGTGASSYSAPATGATPAQERYIRSLCEERGIDADARLATIKSSRDASKAIDELKAIWAPKPVRLATERQLQFLQDLLAERVHDYGTDGTGLSFDAASAMITALLDAPKAKIGAHGIRHGRYAFQPAEGPAQFYRVAQGGRIYVIAGPSEHPYNGKLNEALEAIKADTKTHAALYGQLIGQCGRCGLPLTDEVSRAQGLGPICIGKSDW